MASFINRILPSARAGSLPAEVSATIEGISISVRHGGDPETETPRRVIVFGLAGAPFVFTWQGCKRRVADAWPELNDRQIARAVKWVEAEVNRRVNYPKTNNSRRGWIWNW
mgnify:CR=1 FL=1